MVTIVFTLHNDGQYQAGVWTTAQTYVEPIALVRALKLWRELTITIHRIY